MITKKYFRYYIYMCIVGSSNNKEMTCNRVKYDSFEFFCAY
jgi:hypothetical protein